MVHAACVAGDDELLQDNAGFTNVTQIIHQLFVHVQHCCMRIGMQSYESQMKYG